MLVERRLYSSAGNSLIPHSGGLFRSSTFRHLLQAGVVQIRTYPSTGFAKSLSGCGVATESHSVVHRETRRDNLHLAVPRHPPLICFVNDRAGENVGLMGTNLIVRAIFPLGATKFAVAKYSFF